MFKGPSKEKSKSLQEWNPETKILQVEETKTLGRDLIRASIILDDEKIAVTGSDSDIPQLITRSSVSAATEKEAWEKLEKKGFVTDYKEGDLIVTNEEQNMTQLIRLQSLGRGKSSY